MYEHNSENLERLYNSNCIKVMKKEIIKTIVPFHLLCCRPRESNHFSVDVNVAAQEKVIFNLTYQELLKRNRGSYEHVIYIDPQQVVKDLQIKVAIEESRDITSVKVPPLRNDLYEAENTSGTYNVKIIHLTIEIKQIPIQGLHYEPNPFAIKPFCQHLLFVKNKLLLVLLYYFKPLECYFNQLQIIIPSLM